MRVAPPTSLPTHSRAGGNEQVEPRVTLAQDRDRWGGSFCSCHLATPLQDRHIMALTP